MCEPLKPCPDVIRDVEAAIEIKSGVIIDWTGGLSFDQLGDYRNLLESGILELRKPGPHAYPGKNFHLLNDPQGRLRRSSSPS